MKNSLKYFFSVFLRALLLPFGLFPIRRDRLVFSGLTGGGGFEYSCNPRYVSDYIRRQERGRFEIYWMVDDPGRYAGYGADDLHFLKHFSVRSFYYLLTARVVVTNGSYAPWFPFRRGQYLINTWHGGGAYKRIENARPDAGWAARKRAEFCSRNISLFVSSCEAASEQIFRQTFLYRGEILECGMPRNDLLVRGETQKGAVDVRRHYGLEPDARILLYAPTYREKEAPKFPDLGRIRNLLEKEGETWYVLYRGHRYMPRRRMEGDGILDAGDYEDMQSLLAGADMLITDYSSCVWDYSFLYRPCFLYTPDLEDYLRTNGFYVDIYRWGFPVCPDEEALVRAIETYDAARSRGSIERHHREMGSFEGGQACRAVCERIISVCEET